MLTGAAREFMQFLQGGHAQRFFARLLRGSGLTKFSAGVFGASWYRLCSLPIVLFSPDCALRFCLMFVLSRVFCVVFVFCVLFVLSRTTDLSSVLFF